MLATDRAHMETVLAAAVKAIFVVMGEPNTVVRQCPLAIVVGVGHWTNTNHARSHHQYQQALPSLPYKYLNKVLDLLNLTWHPNQHCFKVSEAQKLTGKLARLVKGENWVFHLLSYLYPPIAYALSKNRRLLIESSYKF
jgi:hypothetical protein